MNERYSIALMPFIDGEALGVFEPPPDACAGMVRLLRRLHAASALVEGMAPTRSLEIPGRKDLDAALADLDRPWSSGPIAEDARRWLAANATAVRRRLGVYDSLAAEIGATSKRVITHGEPHAGNFMRSAGKLWLVDWDTVAFAPPERDLWLCCHTTNAAIRLFTIGWQLADIAAYLSQLRRPHSGTEDDQRAMRVLNQLSAAQSG